MAKKGGAYIVLVTVGFLTFLGVFFIRGYKGCGGKGEAFQKAKIKDFSPIFRPRQQPIVN